MQEVKYSGKIIEVIEEKHGNKVFEIARRSPGVRALIFKNNKILLSREFRTEINGYDYRLPGGKVFDTLEEYRKHINEDLTEYAKVAVKNEVRQEVGLEINSPKLIKVSKAGATVVWDLYYFEIREFTKSKQHLEDGEDITFNWYTFDQVKQFCKNQQIQEDRSVAVILNYLLSEEKVRSQNQNK
jgi:ADP-ribose pyrophosphatase YjhB (NUDIX family)